MKLERLKELRTARELRQSDMANYLKIDRTTYVKYENGASEPPLATLIQIAEYFNVSVDYIVGKNNVNLPENEMTLLKIFRQLTDTGQAAALGAVAGILSQPGMRKEPTIASAM